MTVDAVSLTMPAEVHVSKAFSGDLEIDVVQLDREEGPGFGFRVVLSDSEHARYWVHSRALDGGPELFRYARNGKIIARDDPRSRRLEWAVAAQGYRPVYGTEGDFGPDGEDRFFASVRLERGWGTRVLVRDQVQEPIVGAQVFVDGKSAGITDASGSLDVHRETRPVRIEVRYLGWSPASTFPAVSTNPAVSGPWHEIVLVRREG